MNQRAATFISAAERCARNLTPEPTSEENDTTTLTIYSAVQELTSPHTVIVATENELFQPIHTPRIIRTQAPPINVRKGQKINLNMDFEYAVTEHVVSRGGELTTGPIMEFKIEYDDSTAMGPRANAIQNTTVVVGMEGGYCYGLRPDDPDIRDLSRLEVHGLSFDSPGYYHMHFVIECEKERGDTELLGKIVSQLIMVSN
ncbi:hypothetical protein F4804DRAFT_337944 [Jackrogersella minutella]|nr:hypothetical protein F4804DRAFT_337944 [Jackrogersella minutella]